MGNGNDGLMKLSDAGPMVQQVLRIAALDDFWDHLASMEEKVYFEFEAEIQGRQTHFLIEVDKKTEDPELRVISPRSKTPKVQHWSILPTRQRCVRLS